jgi:hypothetical protein
MKLTQGSITFYDIPLSETTGTTGVMIKIGDDEKVLACSVALDPLGRHSIAHLSPMPFIQ